MWKVEHINMNKTRLYIYLQVITMVYNYANTMHYKERGIVRLQS